MPAAVALRVIVPVYNVSVAMGAEREPLNVALRPYNIGVTNSLVNSFSLMLKLECCGHGPRTKPRPPSKATLKLLIAA